MRVSEICRYCGGVIRLVPAEKVYQAATERLKQQSQWIYQCQNCNARVGCHRDSKRPLGNVANEVLRLKRMETHQIFDAFWRSRGMSRTAAYRWLAKQMKLPAELAHIGGFEMEQCQRLISLCHHTGDKEAA